MMVIVEPVNNVMFDLIASALNGLVVGCFFAVIVYAGMKYNQHTYVKRLKEQGYLIALGEKCSLCGADVMVKVVDGFKVTKCSRATCKKSSEKSVFADVEDIGVGLE